MSRFRLPLLLAAGVLGSTLLPFTASADGLDSVIPLNGTAAAEVPAGGESSVTGILLPAGTTKGSLQVKVGKGTGLKPLLSLLYPDGTLRDADDLAGLGATVKIKGTSVTVSNLPTLEESGLYRVVVRGDAGDDGLPTSGAFTLRIKGKPSKGYGALLVPRSGPDPHALGGNRFGVKRGEAHSQATVGILAVLNPQYQETVCFPSSTS